MNQSIWHKQWLLIILWCHITWFGKTQQVQKTIVLLKCGFNNDFEAGWQVAEAEDLQIWVTRVLTRSLKIKLTRGQDASTSQLPGWREKIRLTTPRPFCWHGVMKKRRKAVSLVVGAQSFSLQNTWAFLRTKGRVRGGLRKDSWKNTTPSQLALGTPNLGAIWWHKKYKSSDREGSSLQT